MSPSLHDGDFVLTLKFFTHLQIKLNRKVVFNHPKYGLLIKRIDEINFEEKYFFAKGENLESVSRKDMGKVFFDQIKGFPVLSISR